MKNYFHNISGDLFSFNSVLNMRRNTFSNFLQCTPNYITWEIFCRCWPDDGEIQGSPVTPKLVLNCIFLLDYLFLKNALSGVLEWECSAETVVIKHRSVSMIAKKDRDMKQHVQKTATEWKWYFFLSSLSIP